MEGLNVTHLSVLVCSKILELIFKGIVGLGLIFNGRIKGHMKTRFVPKIKALCVSSFSNRILDIGYISSVSSLGLVGVKVGFILWTVMNLEVMQQQEFMEKQHQETRAK